MKSLSRFVSSIPAQLLGVSVILTAALYWRALFIPIYHDDVVILRAVSSSSFGDIFTTTIGLGYYRPLSHAVWKLYQTLWGYFPPMAMHIHPLFFM